MTKSRLDAAAGLPQKARMAKLREKLGVVILGAGASSRMGQPKLLLPWRGTTVIGQIVSQWQQLGGEQIAVVMRENDLALSSELDRLKFSAANRIYNSQPERGMFSSIVGSANWSGWRQEISRWAIVLGDQPHLRTETLRRLLEFSAQNLGVVCQPEFDGHTGHPAILPRQSFDELKKSKAVTLKDFLKLTVPPFISCPVADAGLSLDLDTPEDYKRLTASIDDQT